MKIKIKSGNIEANAELKNTETAKKIYDALPLTGMANRWGNEIYFSIPIYLEEEKDSKEIVEIGDIAYWPTGNCFCIFFGKVIGDAATLKTIKDGDEIIVSKAK